MEAIDRLPINRQRATSDRELQVVDRLLRNGQVEQQAVGEFKESMIFTVLFVAVANPFVDGIIRSMCPSAENTILLWVIKAGLFFVLYYIILRSYIRGEKSEIKIPISKYRNYFLGVFRWR